MSAATGAPPVRREVVDVSTRGGRVLVTSAYGMTRHRRGSGDVFDVVHAAMREHIRQAPDVTPGAFPGMVTRAGRGLYRVTMWSPA